MKEIKKIIEDLERIFPVVNSISEEAAATLITAIKNLTKFSFTDDILIKGIKDLVRKNPKFLTDVIKMAGPTALVESLFQIMNITDDYTVNSKDIPNLESYSLKHLKKLVEKLERHKDKDKDDGVSRYILDGLKKHIKRREEGDNK